MRIESDRESAMCLKINWLKAEVEKLTAERDAYRTELDAWKSAFGTSQLTHALAERDAAMKALESANAKCAEMGDALVEIRDVPTVSSRVCLIAANVLERNDCGKGYVKAESLKCFKCDDGHTPLYCLNCAREGYHADSEWMPVVDVLKDIATDDLDRVSGGMKQSAQQALAHAERITGGGE